MTDDQERTREALQFIAASDRDTWLRMGMAIKSELADAGFNIWDAWSQQAASYNARDARDVWKSIKAGGGVGIGTLYHEAKAAGWRDDGAHQTPTPEAMAERRHNLAELAAKNEADEARERADAAKNAAAIWKAATPVNADNPYLKRKQVSPVATLREIDADAAAAILGYAPKSKGEPLAGRLLVVPVKQGDRLSTLELIDGDKRKAALAGRGTKTGGFWAAQPMPKDDGPEPLAIGEGVATVLSGKEASGHLAIAALSASNLPSVAKAMRALYPTRPLIFLADLVKATGAPDPHAIEAARAVGGMVAIPDFGENREPGQTDFNDLAKSRGLEAVGRAIANATAPARPDAQAGDSNGYDWPEPQSIPATLLPVDAFDSALLPESIRAWVADIAERMQCPPDFPAVGAMVALSSVIGRKACIAPKRRDDWRVVPNLWGAVVGRPGVMKSPALSEVMKPLDRLALLANDLHKEAMRDHEINSKLDVLGGKDAEKKAAALVGKGKTEEARQKRQGTCLPRLQTQKVTRRRHCDATR